MVSFAIEKYSQVLSVSWLSEEGSFCSWLEGAQSDLSLLVGRWAACSPGEGDKGAAPTSCFKEAIEGESACVGSVLFWGEKERIQTISEMEVSNAKSKQWLLPCDLQLHASPGLSAIEEECQSIPDLSAFSGVSQTHFACGMGFSGNTGRREKKRRNKGLTQNSSSSSLFPFCCVSCSARSKCSYFPEE